MRNDNGRGKCLTKAWEYQQIRQLLQLIGLIGPGRAHWAHGPAIAHPGPLEICHLCYHAQSTPAQSPLHRGRCHRPCHMVWLSSYMYPTLTRALSFTSRCCCITCLYIAGIDPLLSTISLLWDTSRVPQRAPMDTCRERSIIVFSGPNPAGASKSILHSQESREERGSATRHVPACTQQVSGPQLLVSGPLLLAHSSFLVLHVFFVGETGRLGPTGPAYVGWNGLGSGFSGLVSASLQGSLLITDTTTHGETPGPHSGSWGKLQLATSQARFLSEILDASKSRIAQEGEPN